MKLLLATCLLIAATHAAPTDTSRPALRVRKQPATPSSLVVADAPTPSSALRGGETPSVAIPQSLALAIGAGGIFASFSVFAVLQEDVYKKAYGGEFFKYTFFALLLERGINALTALAGVAMLGKSGLTIPQKEIFNSGVSQMLAMAASNEALRYVSYPTQVLGKSCKMVPVMAGGIVLGGKRYSVFEYVQVALITIGVCIFNFGGKKKKGGGDSPLGLILVGISLLMDAVTGGLQDKVKKSTRELNPLVSGKSARPSMHESMLYTNASGFLVAFILALVTGQLVGGVKFCAKHPQVLTAILVYSLSSAVGQNFVYYTLTQFNPLVLTTVTTTRKIFSTLYSVFRNPSNSLSGMQWGGTSMVFAGLLGDIAAKTIKNAAPPPKKDLRGGAGATEAADSALEEGSVTPPTTPPSPSDAAPEPEADMASEPEPAAAPEAEAEAAPEDA